MTILPDDETPRGASRGRIALAIASAIAVAIATFPGPAVQVIPTLDGSWLYEINRLPHSQWRFGPDVAFTYGPLGFLLYPADYGDNLAVAQAFRFGAQLLFAVLVYGVVLRARSIPRALVVVVAAIAAPVVGMMYEYQLLLVAVLIAARAVAAGPGTAWMWLVAASAWASLGLFIKTSLGIGAASACAVAAVLLVARRQRFAPAAVALSLAAGAAAVYALSATLLSSAGGFFGWMRSSFQLASEFSVAMAWEGPRSQGVAAGILLVLCAAIAVQRVAGRPSASGDLALIFAGPAFLAFKHGFVRQDLGHVLAFFPFLFAAAGLVLAEATTRTVRALAATITAGSAAVSITLLSRSGYAGTSELLRGVSGARGAANVVSWLDLDRARRDTVAGRVNLKPDELPGLPQRVRDSLVGVVPWEMAYCAANDLRCVPNPTLQLYAAYTADLDRATAAHYAGARAPRYLIAEYVSLDARNTVLDTPATWRSIREHYRPMDEEPAPGKLLLERRDAPAADGALAEVAELQLVRGRWVELPDGQGRLSAEIPLDLTLLGRIAKTLFRIPPVHLELIDCGGSARSYRVAPDVLRNGFPLSALPESTAELRGFVDGTFARQPLRLRISGPGTRYYRKPIRARILTDGSPSIAARCEPAGFSTAGLARRAPPAGAPLLYIDEFGGRAAPFEAAKDGVKIERDGAGLLMVRGWAVDPVRKAGAAALVVTIDGEAHVITCGSARSDVGTFFGEPGYNDAGCAGAIPVDDLAPGDHQVGFQIVGRDRAAVYDAPQTLRLSVR